MRRKTCLCGCGGGLRTGINNGTVTRFVHGHDARFYAWCMKISDGRLKYRDLPNDEARRNVRKAIAGKWREKAFSRRKKWLAQGKEKHERQTADV